MKILQIIPTISGGGAERFVVDLSNELAKTHSVSLLTLYNPREEDIFRKDLSGKVVSFSLNKQPGLDKTIAFRLFRIIKKIKPDIIHNHLRSINYLLPVLPFLGKIPVVHTIHNDAFRECPNARMRRARQFFFNSGKMVPVAISDESYHSFMMAYKNSAAALIKNGRSFPKPSSGIQQVKEELTGYKRNDDTKVFLHIGRMEPQKNQLMLAEAFSRLITMDHANAILLFIGGGRNTAESRQIQSGLEAFARSGIGVYVLGEKTNATDYLYASDFFCLSSTFEGMPISLIEAMAVGAVPVCTPVGGIPEVLNDIDASLLSEATDTGSYYNTLKWGYGLRDSRYAELRDLSKALYEERYSMVNCADKYSELYQELISNE
ncbi:MAG TPA: glycosyltransferase [Edaphocola sp.]|nr:glycosyltransferase [Edaphocola sp.]